MESNQEYSFHNFNNELPESIIGYDFYKCNFINCDFTDLSFNGILDRCTFNNCNLTLTSFKHAKLQDVLFDNCKLLGINFNDSDKLGLKVRFKACLIRSCNLNYLELKNTDYIDCIIIETDFVGANLSNCNFMNTEFKGVMFHNTNLSKADFTGAKDYIINPLTNSITDAKFSLPDAVSLLTSMGIKLV